MRSIQGGPCGVHAGHEWVATFGWEASWGLSGPSWDLLGTSWGLSVLSLRLSGPSWGHLGAIFIFAVSIFS